MRSTIDDTIQSIQFERFARLSQDIRRAANSYGDDTHCIPRAFRCWEAAGQFVVQLTFRTEHGTGSFLLSDFDYERLCDQILRLWTDNLRDLA